MSKQMSKVALNSLGLTITAASYFLPKDAKHNPHWLLLALDSYLMSMAQIVDGSSHLPSVATNENVIKAKASIVASMENSLFAPPPTWRARNIIPDGAVSAQQNTGYDPIDTDFGFLVLLLVAGRVTGVAVDDVLLLRPAWTLPKKAFVDVMLDVTYNAGVFTDLAITGILKQNFGALAEQLKETAKLGPGPKLFAEMLASLIATGDSAESSIAQIVQGGRQTPDQINYLLAAYLIYAVDGRLKISETSLTNLSYMYYKTENDSILTMLASLTSKM